MFWRGLFVATSLTVFIVLTSRGPLLRFGAMGRPGLVFAALSATGNILFVISITQTDVANTLVIIAAAPLLAVLLSHFVLAEPIDRRTWIAAVAVLLGVAVVFSGSFEQGHLVGDLAALAGALVIAGWMTLIRRYPTVPMIPALALGGLLAAAVAFSFAAPITLVAADFRLLALSGFVLIPIALGLIVLGPRYLPAPEVSLLILGDAVIGTLLVWLVIGEQPTIEAIASGLVIITALGAHAIVGSRQPSAAIFHEGP